MVQLKVHEELFPLAQARKQALEIIEELQPGCHKIAVAGSVRRKRPQVHDIDLIAWPIYEQVQIGAQDMFGQVNLVNLMVKLSELILPPNKTIDPDTRILHLAYPIPVELYLTEPYGENFGALLQMRTGPAAFNVQMAIRAKKLHLSYKAGYGLFNGKVRVDEGDHFCEDGIFQRLGLKTIPPEQRDKVNYLEEWKL